MKYVKLTKENGVKTDGYLAPISITHLNPDLSKHPAVVKVEEHEIGQCYTLDSDKMNEEEKAFVEEMQPGYRFWFVIQDLSTIELAASRCNIIEK